MPKGEFCTRHACQPGTSWTTMDILNLEEKTNDKKLFNSCTKTNQKNSETQTKDNLQKLNDEGEKYLRDLAKNLRILESDVKEVSDKSQSTPNHSSINLKSFIKDIKGTPTTSNESPISSASVKKLNTKPSFRKSSHEETQSIINGLNCILKAEKGTSKRKLRKKKKSMKKKGLKNDLRSDAKPMKMHLRTQSISIPLTSLLSLIKNLEEIEC